MAKHIHSIDELFPKKSLSGVPKTDDSDKTELTLMSALEKIVIVTEDCELAEEELRPAEKAIAYVCGRTDMNKMQAIMFAICVDQCYDTSITIGDIRKWIGCPMISLLKHQNDLDALLDMGFLSPGSDTHKCYAVPPHVIAGLNSNKVVTKENNKNLGFVDFFNKMGEYFLLRRQGWGFEQLRYAINALVKDNPQLTYCKRVMSLPALDDTSIVLLHYFCHRLVNHNDSYIDKHKLDGILDRRADLVKTIRYLMKEKHPLMKLELVELSSEEGFAGDPMFTLTNKARKEILVEADVELLEKPMSITNNELIAHDKIREKHLFYDKEVEGAIDCLTTLLVEENFASICSRLEKHGLRKGFACLFYGAPGTGKTETALQLARLTGRDITRVDISEMRSKWVGESQKMVKSLFDRYRRAVNTSALAPILLFNEADALLTKRSASCETSVDKMENAMQNIFLQEIETLEGILIATTNLTDNLDPAFERRFLYKVEFLQPDAECRANIWQSMIAGISSDEAISLAVKYDFSGGQIENISRKCLIDSILYGEPDDLMATIVGFCESELINNRAAKKVGFAC